jgi:hypothetical protein
MRKLMVLSMMAALIVSGAGLLACGGGGEKQAGQEPESKSAEETVVAEKDMSDKGDDVGGSGWKDIPIYSGASSFDSETAARMSATMSGMHEGGRSEVQLFKTGDDYEKVVSYYKSHMPRKGWEKVMDREEEEGWGSVWQKKDGRVLVNVSVIKDIEGECGIIIGRHEGTE